MKKKPIRVKVIFLGNVGVGKSRIVTQYINYNHQESECGLGYHSLERLVIINDKKINFYISDTEGQERYGSLPPIYYRDATAAIMVYDITQKDSFEGLKKWYSELIERWPKFIQLVIVGNKQDLAESEVVNPEEAQAFANSIGAMYKKSSAKTYYGIEEIFQSLAEKILHEITMPCSNVSLNNKSSEAAKNKKFCS